MNWKELAILESKGWESINWRDLIDLFQNSDDGASKSVDFYTRFNFALVMLLVEVDFESFGYEEEYLADLLQGTFLESNEKFANDAEYLFFTGITAYIAEWYFGMESVDPAQQMLETAARMQPENLLFNWAAFLWADQNPKHNPDEKLRRANDIILLQPSRIQWLRSKGMMGQYVLGILEGAIDSTS